MKHLDKPVPLELRLDDFEWLVRSLERRAALAQTAPQQCKELECYVRHFYNRN